MNSNNTTAIIRSLITYALCIPLAVWVAFLVAEPADKFTFGYGGILALLFLMPLLLRWHHFLLIAGWNFGMTIFFLPGTPPVWMLLTLLSLGISVLHRTVNSRAHFISAPEITRPLLFFLAVVLVTAKLTGGMGLHSMGGEVAGGRKYVSVIGGILAYFALTAVRIPPHRVGLYITFFFLMGCSRAIGDLAPFLPSSLNFIFAFFPATGYDMEAKPGLMDFHARYAGLGALGSAGFFWMLARYGVRGILLGGKPWRWVLFGLFFMIVPLGGFRMAIIACIMVFTILFFMERLYRTNAMPVFVFAGLITITLIIPFANQLPYTFQRSLAFLPLKIDTAARMDADASKEWRLGIWQDFYPRVPQYLLLGKGYALSQDELAAANNLNFDYMEAVYIVGNYHSGPLSLLIPFGAWGAIALLWFWFASLRVLYDNYRYGDPAFHVINIFLFANFICSIVSFLFVFGAIENDLASFAVLIGLSISINGGVRRAASVARQAVPAPAVQPRLQPSYQR